MKTLAKYKLTILLSLTLLGLMLLAFFNRFIQDDAFISFRYAQNLVQQGELTWNPGETDRVEGYTNFLWTLLMAVPHLLGIDPVPFSMALGLLCAFGSFITFWHLSAYILKDFNYRLLALVLLGTNYTFSAYATGGLETQLQALLILLGTLITLRLTLDGKTASPRSLAALSILAALALLTRLDSALPFTVLYAAIGLHLLMLKLPPRKTVGNILMAVLPAALILGVWFAWKLSYYGDLLPNTFYAKTGGLSYNAIYNGIFYLYKYAHSYLLIPFAILSLLYLRRLANRTGMRIVIAITALWLLYIIYVGGDFMEFRFLVPITPFIMLLITALIQLISLKEVKFTLAALVLAGSFHHQQTFTFINGIEPVDILEGHLTKPGENWVGAGKTLAALFRDKDDPVVIAVSAAGAIPYYSQLPTVDVLGLNDVWIARNGITASKRAGHQKRPTLDYLLQREVNLVIAYPLVKDNAPVMIESANDLKRYFLYGDLDCLPADAVVLEIPVASGYNLQTLYLTPHPAVDRLITERGLITHEIDLNN